MESDSYDPRYLRGIEHFNECEFYESHEVWEDLWKECEGPMKSPLKGLIQVAVALHHLQSDNLRGATNLWTRAEQRLARDLVPIDGLNLTPWLSETKSWFKRALAIPSSALTPPRLPSSIC